MDLGVITIPAGFRLFGIADQIDWKLFLTIETDFFFGFPIRVRIDFECDPLQLGKTDNAKLLSNASKVPKSH